MGAFKDCDIRGVFGEDITLDMARSLGLNFGGRMAPGERVALGRDARPSGEALASSVAEGLVQAGAEVLDLGLVPTPVFTWWTVHEQTHGIMVTASHNPPEYNGFKVVAGGCPVVGDALRALEQPGDPASSSRGRGRLIKTEVLESYILWMENLARVLGIVPARRIKVVVDSGNGCAALTAGRFLRDLGVEVIDLFPDLDGTFPHRDPNPAKPGVLVRLGEEVRRTGAEMGVGFDGDGDRACFVDELGQALSPEATMLCLLKRIVDGPEGIVYDGKCSMIVPRFVIACGGRPVMERSGYAFIRSRMLSENALFGAELSGHYFFRSLRGSDDAMLSTCFFASIVSRLDRPVSVYLGEFPTPFITSDIRVRCDADIADDLLTRVHDHFQDWADVSRSDGVRVVFKEGWALLRKSITEPVMTFRFEGETSSALRTVIERLLAILPEKAEEVRKQVAKAP